MVDISLESIKNNVINGKDTCKISFKHILFASVATIFFFYIISNKLNINYRVAFLNDDFTNTNGFVFSYFTLENKSHKLNCSPIDFNYVSYSVSINGNKYPKWIPLYMNKSINFKCLNQIRTTKTILAWNSFFGDYSYSEPFKSQDCPVKNCLFTSNKSLINNSDLVLVHMRDSIADIPKYRPPFQRWVFVLYESPIHSGDFNRYSGVFNLTSTYKIESNFSGFYESYSKIEWKFNSEFNDSFDFHSRKSKFATAVISNCGASSRRLDYIKEMQNSISVDVYGRCGKKCPNKFPDSSPGDCKEILGREYKFYLAFENSICQDYITEKFFSILSYDIIPVVLGGGLYENYIPKSGFIDARNYRSPKDLANYLIYLDNNSTAYNSYFKWKKHVHFQRPTPPFSPICDMCIKLYLEEFFGIQNSIIENIGGYWDKKSNCKSVDANLKIV